MLMVLLNTHQSRFAFTHFILGVGKENGAFGRVCINIEYGYIEHELMRILSSGMHHHDCLHMQWEYASERRSSLVGFSLRLLRWNDSVLYKKFIQLP